MRHEVHGEPGFTLVELLIAMTLMAVGIAAIVAGFSSGVFAIDRASKATSAGSVADTVMEGYRQGPWNTICTSGGGPTCTVTGQAVASLTTGADSRTYWVATTTAWYCSTGSFYPAASSPTDCRVNATGSPLSCPFALPVQHAAPAPAGWSTDTCIVSRLLKLVSIDVRAPTNQDGTSCAAGTGVTCNGRLFYHEDSTFDSSTS